jgi:hypothetical protein
MKEKTTPLYSENSFVVMMIMLLLVSMQMTNLVDFSFFYLNWRTFETINANMAHSQSEGSD